MLLILKTIKSNTKYKPQMYTFIYPSHPSHLINIINIYIWWKINFLSICWLLQWCIYLIIWFMSILVVWRWYHKINCYLDWRGNSNFQNEHTIDRNQTKFQFKKKSVLICDIKKRSIREWMYYTSKYLIQQILLPSDRQIFIHFYYY